MRSEIPEKTATLLETNGEPRVAALERDLIKASACVELAEKAARAPDLESLYAIVDEYVPRVLGAVRSSLAISGQGTREHLFSLLAIGETPRGLISDEHWFSAEGMAIELACREKRSITSLEFPADRFIDWRHLGEHLGLQGFIVSPLLSSSGAALGTFNLALPAAVDFGPAEVARARQLAGIVASCLERRRLTTRLQASYRELAAAQTRLIQREKLAALGDLVAGFAHELNTPLGVAVTATSLIREELERARTLIHAPKVSRRAVHAQLNRVTEGSVLAEESLQRSASIVRDLMERVTQDWAAQVGVIDLQVFCSDIIRDLQPLLHRKRCAVLLDIDQVTVSCDLGALRNILLNLVQNACLHAYDAVDQSAEPRRIEVTARCSDGESGVVVCLTVRDWGKGIAPDAWNRIFEPFFTTRRGQGCTGLGLHLAYTAASGALGGSLECRAAEPGIALVCTFPSLELTPEGESIRP